ncbi:FAD-dependent oxidoreductase [Mycolicibacterium aichiense]|uniref:Dehydrogenase n=2 Tax=Mycolicibacterium TaxID=1866885 RepID=A0AAD1HPN9_9MYCO|nr:FAD-dependent oxidoreductase [Mycolicibacterium aichiense]MCV7018814.1 FAD-dependent oxidoreductase [Mycolicibacterium aichiense]BBX08645.1 dehydrogenase [Mycolicibacterium aichiense]STZ82441.1 amine oxidase [Mycolicibacterium aichiense]
MIDPRRVAHPAITGVPHAHALPATPHVVVVGGGIAGLSAATGLAERGVSVDLLESQHYLGGRVGGWTEQLPDGTQVANNRGFHAFFRQYYNLRWLLRRTDPELERLRAVEDYPLVDGEGRRDTFRGLPKTPPWNALAFALRSPTFRMRDLMRLNAVAAAPLAAVSVPEIYEQLDGLDAGTFLTDINFPVAARHLAFEVFARSFFARPERLSAAELATMFHIYFLGSSEGLVFDVAASNFDTALWEPLGQYLIEHGVRVHRGVAVESVTRGGGKLLQVRDSTGATIDADGVVLATDVAALQRIVAASPGLGDQSWRHNVAQMQTAPPFMVQRLWLDRPVNSDRPAFLGTGGLDPVDNISVVSGYESEAAEWARAHHGSVVEVHSYSVGDAPAVDELRDRMLARLHQLYPETAAAGIVNETLLVRDDCPLFSPGAFANRPTVDTPVPGLTLAGDGIRIDLPVALMERAATTGWTAANHLLAGWGISGHTLHTVPVHGRSPLLRRLASRERRAS